MSTEKKRSFIINFFFVLIVFGLIYVVFKYAIYWVMPFLIAFLIAAILHPFIKWICKKLKLKARKPIAIIITVLFFCTVGVLLGFIAVRLVLAVISFIEALPGYYLSTISPALESAFIKLSALLANFNIDVDISMKTITDSLYSGIQGFTSLVSSAYSVISRIPNILLSCLILIISTFFITMDFEDLTKWSLAQLPRKTAAFILEIKDYVVKILFKYARSYALILTITFTELLIGFLITHFITGLENILILSVVIAVFDILPIVGTGTILIPWSIIAFITGDIATGICTIVMYGVIVSVRQVIEPKIVGNQVGLHPIVTLVGMIVGTKLFGVIGLFGLPITFALLKSLNDNGKIHFFKPVPKEEDEIGDAPENKDGGNAPENEDGKDTREGEAEHGADVLDKKPSEK